MAVSVAPAAAESFVGTVVGVQDGDSITVLYESRELKVRLEGIDAPERGQDFSQRAKQFTSNLLFGKLVFGDVRDTDRYGRLVTRVYYGRQDASQEIVRAGLAWHFQAVQLRSDPRPA